MVPVAKQVPASTLRSFLPCPINYHLGSENLLLSARSASAIAAGDVPTHENDQNSTKSCCDTEAFRPLYICHQREDRREEKGECNQGAHACQRRFDVEERESAECGNHGGEDGADAVDDEEHGTIGVVEDGHLLVLASERVRHASPVHVTSTKHPVIPW